VVDMTVACLICPDIQDQVSHAGILQQWPTGVRTDHAKCQSQPHVQRAAKPARVDEHQSETWRNDNRTVLAAWQR
jgi:hypothetical protein